MTISHKSTRSVTEYHFQLSEDISTPKRPDTLGKVVITFENGKFCRCDFPFRGTYNREQWAMLAEIEAEIHRIELIMAANGVTIRSTDAFAMSESVSRECQSVRATQECRVSTEFALWA